MLLALPISFGPQRIYAIRLLKGFDSEGRTMTRAPTLTTPTDVDAEGLAAALRSTEWGAPAMRPDKGALMSFHHSRFPILRAKHLSRI